MFRSWPIRVGLAVATVLMAFLVTTALWGVVFGCFGALLLCCYLGALYLRVGARFLLAADAAVLASLPWLGAWTDPDPPATWQKLPAYIACPNLGSYLARPRYDFTEPLYAFAVYPLRKAAKSSDAFFRVIAFEVGKNTWHVAPLSVFVFWAGLAIAFALPGMAGVLAGVADEARRKWGTAPARSGSTGIPGGGSRQDAPAILWSPRPDLPLLLCSAGIGAIAVFLFLLAVWAHIDTSYPATFAALRFWDGLALALALSGATGALAGGPRPDAASVRWLTRPGLPMLLCSASIVAISLYLLRLVVSVYGYVEYFYLPAAYFELFSVFRILQTAAIAGFFVAFHLRAPFPEVFKFALCGAALGLVLASETISVLDQRTIDQYVQWMRHATPACTILGAAAGAIVYRLRLWHQRAANPLATH
jgi:hypothetical protein